MIEEIRDRMPAPDLDQCILKLGQQLLRQQVAKEISAISKSISRDEFDPTRRQQHDTEVHKTEIKITSNPTPSTVLGVEKDCDS